MADKHVLRPDGFDYDRFLQAQIGEDGNGAPVTVLSAFARLGLEPWVEAQELSALSRGPAHVRLKTRLEAMGDIQSLGTASDAVATRLVALLPRASAPRAANLAQTIKQDGFPIPFSWLATALIAGTLLIWIYRLAQTA